MASVIVLALLFVMIALLLGNNRTIHLLRQDLKRLEACQLRENARLGPARAAPTDQRNEGDVEGREAFAPAATPE
jgi:hypothetical protein